MMTGMRIACTLAAGDLAAQRERSGRLIAASALERTERPDGLRIRFGPGRGVADDLRALVATERECCAWATLVGDRRRPIRSSSTSHRPATGSRRSTPCSPRPTHLVLETEHPIRPVAPNDTHAAFAEAAAHDGIALAEPVVRLAVRAGPRRPGARRQGPPRPGDRRAGDGGARGARRDLRAAAGDVSVLHASRENLLLPVDLVHAPTGTVIEVDGPPSTSPRSGWPRSSSTRPAPRVGFDVEEHRALCREWCARPATCCRAACPRRAFGFGGVQRERAYHDALRDLATPAMGHPPLIRIAAADGDGAAAYRRHRDSLLALAGS